MALGAALVDRARQITNTAIPRKVEGSTQFTPVHGEWFKARVTLEGSPESDDSQSGHRRSVRGAMLLTGTKDKAGQPLALSSADKIEVDSKQLGHLFFEATGDPKPIRKKRPVIGFELPLTQVEEHKFERAVV